MLALGHRLKERFLQIVGQLEDTALDAWIEEAAGSGLKPFQSVARSFRQDYEAIKLALTTPWSTGRCEGQICRVKLVKRWATVELSLTFSVRGSCTDWQRRGTWAGSAWPSTYLALHHQIRGGAKIWGALHGLGS